MRAFLMFTHRPRWEAETQGLYAPDGLTTEPGPDRIEVDIAPVTYRSDYAPGLFGGGGQEGRCIGASIEVIGPPHVQAHYKRLVDEAVDHIAENGLATATLLSLGFSREELMDLVGG